MGASLSSAKGIDQFDTSIVSSYQMVSNLFSQVDTCPLNRLSNTKVYFTNIISKRHKPKSCLTSHYPMESLPIHYLKPQNTL